MKRPWKNFVALLLSILSIHAATAGLLSQATPIDLHDAGNSAVLEVHVPAHSQSQSIQNPAMLALQVVGPKHGQENLLPRFDQLIFSLTGTHYRLLSEQEIAGPKPHKEIHLHVAWRDKSTGSILKESNVSSGHDWQGRIQAISAPSLTLDSLYLPPGDYEVTVTTLSDDPRFDGTFATVLCVGSIYE